MFETVCFTDIDSTNEEAKRRLNGGGLKTPLIIRSESQTAGRGTQGRRWVSPPGTGLYVSIVHPFPETLACWQAELTNSMAEMTSAPVPSFPFTPLLTLAAGVACAEVLRELAHVLVELKPINDLYAQGRKLGGILTESLIGDSTGLSRCRGVITGIGINLFENAGLKEAVEASETDLDRRNQPISVEACAPPLHVAQWHRDFIKHELTHRLAERVDHYYRLLLQGNTHAILTQYLLYKMPRVELPAELREVLSQAGLA